MQNAPGHFAGKQVVMKRWIRQIVIALALIGIVVGVLYEAATRVGRGWLAGEPFYDGRPASYWASEIERWETQDPDWQTQVYARRPGALIWLKGILPDPGWPRLLEGDPDGRAVLEALRKHPSADVQDWARIGIERASNDERGPFKIKHPTVTVSAQLFEVDEAFYQKVVAKSRWHSLADLEKLEQEYLDGTAKPESGESLFRLLDKQKLLLEIKDVELSLGKEASLLSSTRKTRCLPTPAQVLRGQTEPQQIEEGVGLRANFEVTSDRRFVRMRIIERCSVLEGIDRISMLDEKGTVVLGETAYLKESTFSVPRTLPDGGSLLLPLQSRLPAGKADPGRLVLRITPRIRIEAEERAIRGESGR
jgi:hypothetical protein